jgi:hypothetical protein
MIKVPVEVDSGVACFGAAVRAESIQQAVSLAETHYPLAETHYPGSNIRVMFPIDPAAFFEGPADETGLIELEMPERVAV